MAYQVRKSTKITEQIELGDELFIDVEINPSKIATSLIRGQNNITRIQSDLKKAGKIKKFSETPEQIEMLEDVGKAYVDLFNLVFGEENTNIMVEYFEGNWTDMLEQLLPFISDIVVPACKEFAEEKRKKAAKNYKYAQGRTLR